MIRPSDHVQPINLRHSPDNILVSGLCHDWSNDMWAIKARTPSTVIGWGLGVLGECLAQFPCTIDCPCCFQSQAIAMRHCGQLIHLECPTTCQSKAALVVFSKARVWISNKGDVIGNTPLLPAPVVAWIFAHLTPSPPSLYWTPFYIYSVCLVWKMY